MSFKGFIDAVIISRNKKGDPKIWLLDWKTAGWDWKPNIGYSSVVYVDETDEIAIDKALYGASRAYQGFLAAPQPGESFEDRVQGLADRYQGGVAQSTRATGPC